MGAFEGSAPPCEGEDVLQQLNEFFQNPNSDKYRKAKDHNIFGKVTNVPGNYTALIAAYVEAGLTVNPRWGAYLRALGMVRSINPEQGPQNIYDIAQFRDRCLKSGLGMRTIIHEPHDGGHVHTKPGTGIDPEVVDAPFPM
jgi:hypothetical protein